MHYYTKNIADFNNATRHLTRQERSIYSDLLELQYDLETPIPNDLDWICRRILATSESERTDVERTLNEYFDSVEQGFSNGRCESEIRLYQSKRKNAKRAGKASGEARKRNKKPNAISNIEQPLSKRSTNVEQTLNQPITNNQEPITNINPPNPPKGGNRFTKPTLDELIEKFADKVPNPKYEAEAFFDFYESKGWMVGKNKMKSWTNAVSNWVRRRNDNGTHQQGFRKPSRAEQQQIEAEQYRRSLEDQSPG